jgi:hypothetical protein
MLLAAMFLHPLDMSVDPPACTALQPVLIYGQVGQWRECGAGVNNVVFIYGPWL